MRVNLSHPQERERSPPIYYVKIRDGRNLVEDCLVDKIYDDYYGFDIFFKLDLIWEHLRHIYITQNLLNYFYYGFWMIPFCCALDLNCLKNGMHASYEIQDRRIE